MTRNNPYLFLESPDRRAVVDMPAHDGSAGCTVTVELHGGQVFVQVISDTQEARILLDEAYDLPDEEVHGDCDHPQACLSDDSFKPETWYCPDCSETFIPVA